MLNYHHPSFTLYSFVPDELCLLHRVRPPRPVSRIHSVGLACHVHITQHTYTTRRNMRLLGFQFEGLFDCIVACFPRWVTWLGGAFRDDSARDPLPSSRILSFRCLGEDTFIVPPRPCATHDCNLMCFFKRVRTWRQSQLTPSCTSTPLVRTYDFKLVPMTRLPRRSLRSSCGSLCKFAVDVLWRSPSASICPRTPHFVHSYTHRHTDHTHRHTRARPGTHAHQHVLEPSHTCDDTHELPPTPHQGIG